MKKVLVLASVVLSLSAFSTVNVAIAAPVLNCITVIHTPEGESIKSMFKTYVGDTDRDEFQFFKETPDDYVFETASTNELAGTIVTINKSTLEGDAKVLDYESNVVGSGAVRCTSLLNAALRR